MYLEIFLADFAVFRVFWEFRGISRKYLNFAGPRLREISEALHMRCYVTQCSCSDNVVASTVYTDTLSQQKKSGHIKLEVR